MKTETNEYSDYLYKKYLPGRRQYLAWLFYPKILRAFSGHDPIVDLGCGTGEFLRYCKGRHRKTLGVDSNQSLVAKNRNGGFEIILDDICELSSLRGKQFQYA